MLSIKYHYGKFSSKKIDWSRLIPLIDPANAALVRYDGTLTAIPSSSITDIGIALNSENLMSNLQKRFQLLQMDRLGTQCLYPKLSKPIIDQIDVILAKHYNFIEEELDFFIDYDIKYRMGKEFDAYIKGTLGMKALKTRNNYITW